MSDYTRTKGPHGEEPRAIYWNGCNTVEVSEDGTITSQFADLFFGEMYFDSVTPQGVVIGEKQYNAKAMDAIRLGVITPEELGAVDAVMRKLYSAKDYIEGILKEEAEARIKADEELYPVNSAPEVEETEEA